MSSFAYPAFIYRTDDGFRIVFPDFPNLPLLQEPTVSAAERVAALELASELGRLEVAGRAPPTPSESKSLVSVRGGRVITIRSGGASRPSTGTEPRKG